MNNILNIKEILNNNEIDFLKEIIKERISIDNLTSDISIYVEINNKETFKEKLENTSQNNDVSQSNDISQKIKNFRKEKKLTQKELADLCELSVNTIQSYELNRRKPPINNLRKLALILNKNVADFF